MTKINPFRSSTPCREPAVPTSLYKSGISKQLEKLIPIAIIGAVGWVVNYVLSSTCNAYQDIYYNQMKCDKDFKPLGCIPTGTSMVTSCGGAALTSVATVGSIIGYASSAFDGISGLSNSGLKKEVSNWMQPDNSEAANWPKYDSPEIIIPRPDDHETVDLREVGRFGAGEKPSLMDLWMRAQNNLDMGG